MFDFLKVLKKYDSKKQRYVYTPTFVIKPTIKDLMVRGGKFYAIYNENTGLWEVKDPVAIALIDEQVENYVRDHESEQSLNDPEHGPLIMKISDQKNGLVKQWHNFCNLDYQGDWRPLNQKLLFSNQEAKRSDYCSKKLDYPLQEQETPYYDKLCETLYLPTEREKWEWYIGCAIAGDQEKIQKMLVFYGLPGTGKSTIIGKVIVQNIFEGTNSGYCTKFEANDLCGRDTFGTQFLENDCVLAYDDDAEMNMITSKTTLNKIISHEALTVNPKFGKKFSITPNCLLIVGSNEPVQLSPNSGMNRRLIDVRPTGSKLSSSEYEECIANIPFEKSGIAYRCLQTYKKLGRHYYDNYIAEDMLNRTSPFQNFVQENYLALKDGCSLAAAYKLYTDYAQECNFKNVLVRYKFRDTLKLYFKSYDDKKFSGFKYDRIGMEDPDAPSTDDKDEKKEALSTWITLKKQTSIFDKTYADCLAQYEQDDKEHPLRYAWSNCKTTLKDLDTSKTHYVKGPDNLIFLDFDKKGPDGEKDLEENLRMASKFPRTYAEVSKSGGGVHLFYIYTGGDPDKLSRILEDNVEIKVPKGGTSIRRKLTLCNDLPIAEISSGLPLKEERVNDMVDWEGFKNEKKLRKFIYNCIQKKHHGYTRPEVNFIYQALEGAYKEGFTYDVRDLQNDIFGFASNSTNSAQYCMELVGRMHFCSKDVNEKENIETEEYKTAPIIFLDCEIAPSAKQALEAGTKLYPDCPEDTPALFLIEWKYQGDDDVKAMLNPTASEVEKLFKYRIIAFNGISYDSNMLYAAAQGYTPEELYNLSQKLTDRNKEVQNRAKFTQARHLFYADPYEYSTEKMSLKKWEIKLGITHLEWDRDWTQPVPKALWDKFKEYCKNDAVSLEKVFDATHNEFVAKEMLVDLVPGSTMIDSTNSISTKFVKGDADHLELVYTDFTTGKQYGDGVPYQMPIISKEEYDKIGDDWTGVTPINTNQFPGYHLVDIGDPKGPHNFFRGIDIGRGGYVYSNPGMYGRAVTEDSASHHPSSIEQLNLFGKQTKRYSDLKKARYAIKHKDFDTVRTMFDGTLAKYFTGSEDQLKANAKAISTAFKLVLNAFYGMTSSPHDYFEAKDPRNINNIVALRGAMVLKIIQDEVESQDFNVIHIKTDSIKIENPTDEILDYVVKRGKDYGYTFEVEHTWNRICLVDDAQFIGLHDYDDPESPFEWDATGKKFQVPYIYKTLFTHEPITFDDMCETFSVTAGTLHLVFDEGKENEVDQFIGRVGQFTPMITGKGAHLYRVNDGKRYAAAGSTNKETKERYDWLESEEVVNNHLEDYINKSYYISKCNDAIDCINKFGSYDDFVTVDIPKK